MRSITDRIGVNMEKPKVYIDGKEGTTGLQIYERLAGRTDIGLILAEEEKRKDLSERKKLINQADVVFLCLPDAAAAEAVALAENPDTRFIDASTAHRTAPGWDYGIPELSQTHRERIAASRRVANPGCHATGFITSVYPLTARGIIPADYPLTAFSLTGYSGGGKKMIAQYEGSDKPDSFLAPRMYGLTLKHKHLPEMQKICGLSEAPVFCPIVDDYYKGMAVTVMLQNRLLPGCPSAQEIWEALAEWYEGQKVIRVHPFGYDGMISAASLSGHDNLELIVNGHEE